MKRSKTVIWLIRRIRRRIPALIIMTLMHMGHAVLGVCFAMGTRQIVDTATAGNRALFFSACIWQVLVILGTILALTAFRYLRERLMAELERDWKKHLLHSLVHADYSAATAYHSGEILNRMNNDVRTVNEGLLSVVPDFLSMITRLTAAALMLAILDIRFLSLIALAGGVVLLATGVLRRKLKELHKIVSEMDGSVSGLLQEIMEKLLMVQALDAAAEVEHRTEGLLDQRFQMQRRRKNVALTANTGVSILYYGGACLALVWCSLRLLKGEISFGSLTAVTQLMGQLQTPIVGLSGILPKYIAMTASAERLMELEAMEQEPEPWKENAQSVYEALNCICAENLHFSYDRTPVFEDASFSLPKGSFAVVTGHSGIGKSTLLKLLLGIYRPESGRLYLDCSEAKPIDRRSRKMFAYVPQGNLLLSGTLRENLTIGNSEASDEEIERAVHISTVDEFLPQLPMGLETVLGENGIGLSEGQAQRLAIARAVLGGAPILLLDECTSALDPETERTVLHRLRTLRNRTCIAVTHRPAALEVCNWTMEIRDGKIYTEQIRCSNGDDSIIDADL